MPNFQKVKIFTNLLGYCFQLVYTIIFTTSLPNVLGFLKAKNYYFEIDIMNMYVDVNVLRELIREENVKLINDFKKFEEKAQPPLSIGQVALRYGVVKATVHNWINRGLITGFKIGKGRFFDLSEVEINLKDFERFTGVVERRKRRLL